MYDLELRRVEKKIKRLNRIGFFSDKKIYVFGVSDNTRQIIQILRKLGYEPENVIDNDPLKQGSYCARVKVISPNDIDRPGDEDKCYTLYSGFWKEMLPQLMDLGIKRKRIATLNTKPGSIFGHLLNSSRGKRYRNKLIKKYGDHPIFLCPYTGTGDIYLIGTFWDEYIKQNSIDNYIFVVITGACKKVANLFDIKNIEVTRKKYYASWLMDYYLYDNEKGNIKILNDSWPQIHSNQAEWFRGYKGLYFTELFRRFVFELPDDSIPKHPVFKDESQRIQELFDKYELIKGKTVILSPYSNTLADLPDQMWVELAKDLKEKGYCVVTNSSGDTEPPIEGTKGVFFPLNVAPQFIEASGFFVGVRSGFCDVVSGAKAKKIILYDKNNRFYMSSAFEYFSLNAMELSDDAIEFEYDVTKIDELFNALKAEF